MKNFTINQETMFYISLFQKISGVNLKEIFYDSNNYLVFLIPQGTLKKFFDNKSQLYNKLKSKFNFDFKLVEFNSNPRRFVMNLLYPTKADVEYSEGVITIDVSGVVNRAKVLGKNKQNIKDINTIVKKYFKNIKSVELKQQNNVF